MSSGILINQALLFPKKNGFIKKLAFRFIEIQFFQYGKLIKLNFLIRQPFKIIIYRFLIFP